MSIRVDNVAKQLDYKSETVIYPSYRYLRQFPQSGTGATGFNVTTNGGNVSIFEIPSKVMNLAKSYLSFLVTPTALGAGNYNYLYADCLSFVRQIELRTKSGIELCRLEYVNNFTKLIWKPETAYQKYKSFPIFTNWNGGVGGLGQMFCPVNFDNTGPIGRRPNNGSVSVFFTEPLYQFTGGDDTATPVLNIRFPLEMLYYSIFALDKDIYFPEVINLSITWAPTTKMAWLSTSGADPTAGQPAPYAQSINISNLYLYLAIEENEGIAKGVIGDVMAGKFTALIPWTWGLMHGIQNGQSSNFTARYDGHNGLNLCKIVWSYFNDTETGNTAYDCSLIAANGAVDQKIREFYTILDGNRRQDFNLDTSEGDHYFYMKDKLQGSVIQNQNMFDHNFCFIESFMGNAPFHMEKDMIFKYNCGLPLTTEHKYDIIVTSQNDGVGVAYHLYIYGICQRKLTIGPNFVEII